MEILSTIEQKAALLDRICERLLSEADGNIYEAKGALSFAAFVDDIACEVDPDDGKCEICGQPHH